MFEINQFNPPIVLNMFVFLSTYQSFGNIHHCLFHRIVQVYNHFLIFRFRFWKTMKQISFYKFNKLEAYLTTITTKYGFKFKTKCNRYKLVPQIKYSVNDYNKSLKMYLQCTMCCFSKNNLAAAIDFMWNKISSIV